VQVTIPTSLDDALRQHRPAICAILFAFLAGFQCIFVVLALPPIQGSDESNHFMRAYTVARGQWNGVRVGDRWFGGAVDPAVKHVNELMDYLPTKRDRRAEPEILKKTRAVRWTGTEQPYSFNNTTVGSALAYLPSASGIAIGRAMNLPVYASLGLGRFANALLYVAVGTLAIALAGAAAPYLYVVLTLPMAAFLGSFVTPDGPLIVLSALGVAIILRLAGNPSPRTAAIGMTRRQATAFAIAFAALLVVALGKAPYILLVPLLALAEKVPMRWRIAAVTAGLVLSLAWHADPERATMMWPGNPKAQLLGLFRDPLSVFSVAVGTMEGYGSAHLRQVIGDLGWNDARVPPWFVWTAYAALGLTALGIVAAPAGSARVRHPLLALAIVVLGIGAVYGSLYLIWTTVGYPIVEGVQGRYFLPLLPVLALVAAGVHRPNRLGAAIGAVSRPTPEFLLFLLYAVITPFVTIHTIMSRYYW